MIVVDASVSIAWSFRNQRTPELLELLQRVADHGGVAPQLWPIEVCHVVVRAGRRVEITDAEVESILLGLYALDIAIDAATAEQVWGATVALSVKHKLSVYDATYLELAMRLQLPLATLDDELIAAARAEGLTVLP